MHDQDNMYTLTMLDYGNSKTELLGSNLKLVYGGSDSENPKEDLLESLRLLVNAKVITLTVTEKGYNQESKTGSLDFENDKFLQHDLGMFRDLVKNEVENLTKHYLDEKKNRGANENEKDLSADQLQDKVLAKLAKFFPAVPQSSVGWLFLALYSRYLAGCIDGKCRPVTLLCCDNLTANGDMLKRLVTEFVDAVRRI